jgi:hypothetical protein
MNAMERRYYLDKIEVIPCEDFKVEFLLNGRKIVDYEDLEGLCKAVQTVVNAAMKLGMVA